MPLVEFHITRYQFLRDRTIGDSQVQSDCVNVAALELVDDHGRVGLGFIQSLFVPLPSQSELERLFAAEWWPVLQGQEPAALAHRVSKPRGGLNRTPALVASEAVQVAIWDILAKQLDMPLFRLLGGTDDRASVPVYASGLDFHLSDSYFTEFFGTADALGYSAFKIKVGHPDFQRDLHRLNLLAKTVRSGAKIMIDANEAWDAKEAAEKIEAIEAAGHKLLWVEDPIPRNDFSGLKLLRHATPHTQINSGEYLDASGKRALMMAGGADILNVHGQITDVMRIGWLAGELNVPVTVGNTFLEVGVHPACALPEVAWVEYSFQNFDHLVDEPVTIDEGRIFGPERPGHGLVLNEATRISDAQPEILREEQLGNAPPNPRTKRPSGFISEAAH